jgi:beta-phosphoglucomutase-like phosphatase (HAD superfamily)
MSKSTMLSPGMLRATGLVAALAAGMWVMGCGHDHDDHDDHDHAEHAGYNQDHGYQDNVAHDRNHDSGDHGDRDRD